MLKQKISEEIKKALQNKDELLLLVLRGINAAIHNKEIEKRTKLSKTSSFAKASEDKEKLEKLEKESKLTEDEVLEAVASEAKKRKESIVEFEKGGRQDLVDKEAAELEIIKKYLPEQMSEDTVKEIVKKAIKEISAAGPKDIGKVMAVIMPKLKGKAEGGVVSKIVGELLKG